MQMATCHLILSLLESKGGGFVTKQVTNDYIIAMQPITLSVDPLRLSSLYQEAKDGYRNNLSKKQRSGEIAIDTDNLPTKKHLMSDFKSYSCIPPLKQLIKKDAKDLTDVDIDSFLKVLLNDLLLGR